MMSFGNFFKKYKYAFNTDKNFIKDLFKIKNLIEAIKSNINLGKGNGPINHLNSFTINKKFNQ